MADSISVEASSALGAASAGTSVPVEPGLDAQASVSLLQAVADPVRWVVLQRLAERPSCVCNLQEHVPIAGNLLSYHLKVLREAGLVTASRRGRWIDYALAEDALERLHAAVPGPAVTVPRAAGQDPAGLVPCEEPAS